jgi:hypothetical protein
MAATTHDHKEVNMKKVTLFATILALALAMTMTASAQQLIDFDGLPDASSPTAIPVAYGGMSWYGMDYVSAAQYVWANGTDDYGGGFFTGSHARLAFGGGPLCFPIHGGTTIANICESKITANGVGPNALSGFQAVSAVVAAGWKDKYAPYSIVVTAYLNGNLVGSQKYSLTTQAGEINFPSSWGRITELVIHPSPFGSFVLYTLSVNPK